MRQQLSSDHCKKFCAYPYTDAYWDYNIMKFIALLIQNDVSEADGVDSTSDAEVFLTGALPLNFHGLLANGDELFAYLIVVFSILSN